MKNIAIILGGGTSQRCWFDKLFIEKYGKPVIFQTLETFQKSEKIDGILLVLNEQNLEKKETLKNHFPKIIDIIPWGEERVFSLKNGIDFLAKSCSSNTRIIVHNGANPKLIKEELEKWIELANDKKNILFWFFAKDSIKEVQKNLIIKNLNRDEIFCAQTPQISELETFIKAFENTDIENEVIRDEGELLSHIWEEFHIFECSSKNQKITFAHDFDTNKRHFRVGTWEDSHRFHDEFVPGKEVVLWGVHIKCEKSVIANSDGDVILHSLVNALLASIWWKTLAHIADSMCEKWVTDSKEYVEESLKVIYQQYPNFEIQNVSFSLECRTPKLSPLHDDIQQNIAHILGIQYSQVGLNYHTWEKLSDYGKWLGIKCLCNILIIL
jgi:2-C-methyl-D-erythritol 4-phosphate cytidylyltransferase/2-C-methyl-D-erythritol 2,4-cyclodiphosphate synthase